MLKHGMQAQSDLTPTAEDTSRASAKLASYAAAVASRSTLASRLQISSPLGESLAATYAPQFSGHAGRRVASA